MTVKESFEKWRKDKFPALNGVSKREINGVILIFGERAYTAGYKQGVRDEKKRILNGLKKMESNEN